MAKSLKKILLMTLDFPPNIGGVATYYAGICNILEGQMVILTIPHSLHRTTQDLNRTTQKGFIDDYTVYRRNLLAKKKFLFFLPCWLASLYHTFRIVKKEKIKSLAVGNILPLGYAAYLIKMFLRIPYVVFIHGYDILLTVDVKWKKFWAKLILKNARLIVSNSQFTKEQIIRYYQIVESKIKIIYPCVAESLIKKSETLLTSKNDTFCLLSVARLYPRKGIDAVLASLPQVIKKAPRLKYIIVGDGPDKERLEYIVKQLNLANYVEFVGAKHQNELAEYYQQSDVFILTPRQIGHDVEGFGIVYLEANLFGKPVIGSLTGGVPEAVISGQTGLLVDEEQPNQITEAIIELYQAPALRQKLGGQGREQVLKEFRWGNRDLSFL